MSDNHTMQPQGLTSIDKSTKNHALIAYILMVLGFFTGIPWIAGAIWAMVKKGDAQGSLFEDHYSNIITTFWWGLGFFILGVILMFAVVGYFIILGVSIWSIYRIIKGLVKLTSDKAYYS